MSLWDLYIVSLSFLDGQDMGGDQAGGLALAIYCVMSILIIGPALLLFIGSLSLSRRKILPVWVSFASIPVGLMLGYYITYFQVFSDLGEARIHALRAPSITVTVPENYVGFVTVFFDSRLDPLEATGDGGYHLKMSASGHIEVGNFPDIGTLLSYTELKLQYPDGSPAPITYIGATGGGISPTVQFLRAYTGSAEDVDGVYEKIEREDFFGPEALYQSLNIKQK